MSQRRGVVEQNPTPRIHERLTGRKIELGGGGSEICRLKYQTTRYPMGFASFNAGQRKRRKSCGG